MGLDTGRKFCLALMALGALALLIGSVAPFWLTFSRSLGGLSADGQYGLWFKCDSASVTSSSSSSSSTSCGTYKWGEKTFSDYSEIFYVVHILAGLASLLGVVTLFRSLCSICGEGHGIIGIAVMALIGGILGLVAAGLFYEKPYDSFNFPQVVVLDKDWAFFLFIAGSGVVSLFSILLLILQGLHKDDVVSPY